MTLDQLSFCTLEFQPIPANNVPLVGGSPDTFYNIGMGLLKDTSLLGCFPLPLPKIPLTNSIVSTIFDGPIDPWILLTRYTIDSFGDQIPLHLQVGLSSYLDGT